MASADMPEFNARVERAETSRLAWAFTLSLCLHLMLYGGYETGKKFGWWENWQWPAWLQSIKLLSEALKKKETTQPPPQPELPLVFVDVSPSQSTPEPPKESKFYSDKNSLAANPDADANTDAPKIDGKQTKIVKTEDVPRTRTFPLQPAMPAEPSQAPQEPARPKPAYTPGDLALAKPEPIPRKEEGDAPHEKPRTVLEALARQENNNRLVGEKMKQEGGVKRRQIHSSLDVTATAFGAYDMAIIAAVQNRWYDLLDNRNFAGDRSGKVTLRFRLHADGSVSEIAFVDSTVDLALGLLCQSAIKDPAPFAAWPGDMRRQIGAEYREVTFTFFYN
jgi:outer membrane biosynthesis protein TonB